MTLIVFDTVFLAVTDVYMYIFTYPTCFHIWDSVYQYSLGEYAASMDAITFTLAHTSRQKNVQLLVRTVFIIVLNAM